MAKIKSEDLRLNIIVNGDAGRKVILDAQKKIEEYEEKLKSLQKAEGDHSKEIEETNKKLAEAKARYADLLRQLELDKLTIAELKKHITATGAALAKAVPGTDNWTALNNELLISKQRMKELTSQSQKTHEVIFKNFSEFGSFTIGVKALTDAASGLWAKTEQARESWLEYDEALVDAMKTTGLSRDEIEELSAELGKFDTRTAQNELLSLARVGGKLGICGKEDLLQFVSAADKINVALKEDLGGDAEAAIGQIGKLVDIFQLKGQMGLERAMLSVGSAINELGAASTANEGYIVNFTNRLAGIAPNASISIDKILGLASTLDANAQAAETAATAIGQTITAMFKKTETFAQIAQMPFAEFRDLLEKDVNQALVKVLEGMKGDQGLFDIVDAMQEMHLNGQRATTVLGALANNVDMLKEQQKIANEAFQEGTSLTDEFNTKNESATAIQEKLKKRITETSVEIGQKLMPAANLAISGSNALLSIISQLITFAGKYVYALGTVAASIAFLAAKKKIAYLFSVEFRSALLKEVAVLEASSKGNSLHAVSLKILAGGYKSAGAAAKAFGKALIATPAGIAIAVISAIAQGIGILVPRFRESTKELRELNKRTIDTTSSFVNAQTEIEKERKSLEELKEAATSAAEGSDERKNAIAKINELYGSYLPNLLSEKTSNEDLEAALKNVNTQIERKIKLQARENAEMEVQKHKEDTVRSTMGALTKRYEDSFGVQMPVSEMQNLTSKISAAYDTGSTVGIQKPIEELFGRSFQWGSQNSRPGFDFKAWGILEIRDELLTAINKGQELRATINGLYGDLSDAPDDNANKTLGALVGNQEGNKATSTSTAKSAEQLKAEEKERKRKEKAAEDEQRRIEEQARLKTQITIDNEKDLTKKSELEEARRYEEEKKKAEGNAELLELVEKRHRDRLDKIALDAFNREIRRLEDEHKLKRQEMVNSQTAELLAFQGTEEEKAALKRKHTLELANFDTEYLQNLQDKLQTVADSGQLEGMGVSLDDADVKKVEQQLAEIIARKNAAAGTAQEASKGEASKSTSSDKKEGHSIKEGTGKGSLFGVSQDDWEQLFANIEQGKFGAEELQTTISGIGGAAQEAFSLASKFMDNAKKKEDAQLKEYKKNQDSRKSTLEKRLNAGLITESQYNAEVEQMDAEYDAYQEELALKQAKREKTLNLTQAIINTALGVTSTLAQWGVPWGLIPAGVMAAMGAAEIALIASQPITAGAEEGGFINMKRQQDGKSFNAKLNPDARGFVTQPTVIVGENGSEYVIPHEALENPSLLPIISTMETARRNGKLRSLNFNAIYPAGSVPGRAWGGTLSTGALPTGISGTAADIGADERTAFMKALERLTKKLDEPITARVSMLGKGGIKETEDKYNKLKRRGQLG